MKSALLAAAIASQETPTYAPLRIPEGVARPVVDGVLDEPVWQQAPLLSELRQVEPVGGAVPTEATEVRIVYDDASIFVAVLCRDCDPATIRATQRRRDGPLMTDDSVSLFFDTFLDRRNAFYFGVGAGGSMLDALVAKNGAEFNRNWDGIWDAAARVTSEGWIAEFEIPFETLSFPADAGRWGFNVQRRIRRRNEQARWSSPDPNVDFDWVANAGTLTGLHGMKQALGIDVVPFAVDTYARDRGTDREYTNGNAGLDLYWRMTPSFKLSLSANTDFAETEVDERQVNLTRFPLFFPEKRRFFLEDASNFVFAQGEDASVLPFFSRRIGRDDSGDEIPILLASKLTGRNDECSLGLLEVETDSHHDVERKHLLVGRYEQNLFEQSTAGLIFAHGDPTGDARSSTYGADFNYRTDAWLGDDNFRVGGWFLRSATDGVDGRDKAYSARVFYPNDEVEAGFGVTMIEEQFDPLLGFVPRVGVKEYQWQAAYAPRLNTERVRQIFFEVEPSVVTDFGNRTQTSELDVKPFGIETQEGDEAALHVRRVYDHLDDDFEIADGVVIPADGYRFTRYGGSIETSSGRPFTFEAGVNFGRFYGGRETSYSVALDFRPDPLVTGGVDFEQEEVRLPGGSFSVRVTRLRVNLQFSPRLVWSTLVQHDTESDDLGLNSRLRWILRPGREMFAVVNQGWFWSSDRFAQTETQLALKVGYTLRF